MLECRDDRPVTGIDGIDLNNPGLDLTITPEPSERPQERLLYDPARISPEAVQARLSAAAVREEERTIAFQQRAFAAAARRLPGQINKDSLHSVGTSFSRLIERVDEFTPLDVSTPGGIWGQGARALYINDEGIMVRFTIPTR